MTDLPVEGEVVDADAPKIKEITVFGRTFEVMEPSAIQFALIGRSYRRLQRISDAVPEGVGYTDAQLRTAIDTIGQYLDVVNGLVVDPEVQDWLEQQMLNGKIRNFNDVQPLFTAFVDEEPTKPNRAARRAKR